MRNLTEENGRRPAWSRHFGIAIGDAAQGLRLPPLLRDLQIDFTALSLVAPEKVRFRYKLEGYDNDWHEAGNRRQAFYTNLPPGNYTFRVIACNNDGVWNESGAALSMVIPPAFYQTYWFIALCAMALAGFISVLYIMRVRRVAAMYKGRMEERIHERERIARNLHDTFLQSIQGLMLKFYAITNRMPREDATRQKLEKALDQANVMKFWRKAGTVFVLYASLQWHFVICPSRSSKS